MPTREGLVPAPGGHEITTWLPCTGFSDSSALDAAAKSRNAAVESLARPTASTHQVSPRETNRTRAARAPPAAGRSTRMGYQLGPSPTTAATSLQVAPSALENCTIPPSAGVEVEPRCLV